MATVPTTPLVPLGQRVVVAVPVREAPVASPHAREGVVVTLAARLRRALHGRRQALPSLPAVPPAVVLTHVGASAANAVALGDGGVAAQRAADPEAPDARFTEDQVRKDAAEGVAAGAGALRPTVHQVAPVGVPAGSPVEVALARVTGARVGGNVRLHGEVGQTSGDAWRALAAGPGAALARSVAAPVPPRRVLEAPRGRRQRATALLGVAAGQVQAAQADGPATAKQVPPGRHVAARTRPVLPAPPPRAAEAVAPLEVAPRAGQVGEAPSAATVPTAAPTVVPAGVAVAPAPVRVLLVRRGRFALLASRRVPVGLLPTPRVQEAGVPVRHLPATGPLGAPHLGPAPPAGAPPAG